MGITINVANATQLKAALKAVTGGETILLAPGNYGAVSARYLNPGSEVTIRSADPDNDARFSYLRVYDVSNFRFEDIDIQYVASASEVGQSSAVYVTRGSGLNFVGVDVYGSLDGDTWNDGMGLRVELSDHIAVVDCSFTQLSRSLHITKSSDLLVAGNHVFEAREGFNFGAVTRAIIENNLIEQIRPNFAAGDHPDSIQFWNAGVGAGSHDVVIRDNALLSGDSGPVQGIFVGAEVATLRHSNFTIENNLYFGDSRHGISLYGIDGVDLRGNTVVSSPEAALETAISLNNITGARLEGNSSPMLLQTGAVAAEIVNHLDLWDTKQQLGVALELVFTGDVKVDRPTLADFALRADAPAGTAGAGFEEADPVGWLNGGFVDVESYLGGSIAETLSALV